VKKETKYKSKRVMFDKEPKVRINLTKQWSQSSEVQKRDHDLSFKKTNKLAAELID
jgi:hypothetical protein